MYFKKLWQTSKLHFGIITFLMLGQIFFMYKGILNFPFFPFEMYAHPQKSPTTTNLYNIYIDDKLLNYTSLPNWTEGNIINTLKYYQKYQDGNIWVEKVWNQRFGPPTTPLQHLAYGRLIPSRSQVDTYPEWLTSYISEQLNQPIQYLKVTQKKYVYEQNLWHPTLEESVILDYTRQSD